MEQRYYTNERNVQIVIALLKAHGIRNIIASPGSTNATFVISVQNDPFFKVWSSVDERSAAYLACGMASASNEPVAISCTGATSSRNYMPALTEAYYRKLPILAITSHRGNHLLGHLIDQQIDRRQLPNDIAVESVTLPMVCDKSTERYCEIEANKAILALKMLGGGPSHINLYTNYSKDFSIQEIPQVNAIYRYNANDVLPDIPKNVRVVVYIGSHQTFSHRLTRAVDHFCATYDAVAFCDHTSGYHGHYACNFQLVSCQQMWKSELRRADLIIHIGEVNADHYRIYGANVWRVSPDGALRDTFGTLRRVFMMPEEIFFEHYAKEDGEHTEYLDLCKSELNSIKELIPELPFSNAWIASQMHKHIPTPCEFHMGIFNSLRSWNFFELPNDVESHCNVGGFGIDGGISTMIGASFVHPNQLCFGVFGDLAFFYDMNVVGNRHVGNNVRILLINNGLGTEFRNYNQPWYFLGEAVNDYVAAAGHFGNKSFDLVKHYATDLGYEYLSASDKETFLANVDRFLTPEITDKPMIFEIFTTPEDESTALETLLNLVKAPISKEERAKNVVRSILGPTGVKVAKKILGK